MDADESALAGMIAQQVRRIEAQRREHLETMASLRGIQLKAIADTAVAFRERRKPEPIDIPGIIKAITRRGDDAD